MIAAPSRGRVGVLRYVLVLMRYGVWMATAAAGFVLAGCGGTGPEQRETLTDPVEGTVDRVEVESDAGEVRLVAGDRASVEQDLRWTGDAKPEVEHRLDGDVLTVTVRCPDDGGERCQAGLVITVPESAESRVEASAGGIEVSGLTGDQDLQTSAGGVRGTGLGPGSVGARSTAGGVDLAFATPASDVHAESSAGSVDIRVPIGPAYHVTAETTAGSTSVEVPDQPGADHRITARSTAGGVRVVPAD
ncbi:hypothetical protein SAMN05216207_101118 [Pseudonocardia ammonioxydans]|uniref:DUF4097 domain-containing protein n=2 Tax=Pseudonocardia ammonioxydans TaxID=260086 RepID=A0A1I4XET3_PSUAM|nr:hypothetical protein SAMN05216207_101118 [Pseudonocardia ammonioxydans]